MMASFVETWNLAADVWWTWIGSAFWQSAMVGLVLLTLLKFGRRWSSPVRYGLLLIALLKFAVPPLWSTPTGLLSHIVPAQQISETVETRVVDDSSQPVTDLPVAAADQPVVPLAAPEAASDSMVNDLDGPDSDSDRLKLAQDASVSMVAGPIVSPHPAEPSAAVSFELHSEVVAMPGWKAWLLLLHIVGTLVVLLMIVRQIRWLRRVVASSQPARAAIQQETRRLEQQLSCRRQVRVLQSKLVDSPMAFGLITPSIVLPDEASEYSDRDLQTVLGHELAHLRQGDGWINWVQLVLMLVWWVHPVFWLVQRSVRRVSEDCCDDLLIAAGLTTQVDYCETLLRIADRPAPTMMPIACSMAGRLHPLGGRMKRIMDSGVRRTVRLSWLHLVCVIVVAVLLLPGLRSQLAEAQDEPAVVQAADEPSSKPLKTSGEETVAADDPQVKSETHSKPVGTQAETKRDAPTDVPLSIDGFPSYFANHPPSGTGIRVQLDRRRWVELNSLAVQATINGEDRKLIWRPNGELINPPDDFDPRSLVASGPNDDSPETYREIILQVVGPNATRFSLGAGGTIGFGKRSESIDRDFKQFLIAASISGIESTHTYLEVKVTREDWEEVPLDTSTSVQVLEGPSSEGPLRLNGSQDRLGVYVLTNDVASYSWKLECQREGEEPFSGTPSMVGNANFSNSFSFPQELRKSVRDEFRESGGLAFFFEKDKPRPKLKRLLRCRHDVVRFDNLSVYPGPKSAVRVSLNGVPVGEETLVDEEALPLKTTATPKQDVESVDPETTSVADVLFKDEASPKLEFIQLSGKVVDGEGMPVPDCWVGMFTELQFSNEDTSKGTWFDEGPEFSYEATTDADGRFSIRALKTHHVFDGNFWAVRPDGSSGDLRLNCVWPYLKNNLTIKIADSQGQVRIVDENESPVANAEVVLEAVRRSGNVTHELPPEVQKRQRRTTDANGLVTFGGWSSGGIYGVAVTTDRHGTHVLNSRRSGYVFFGGGPLTLKLMPTGRLIGTVAGFDPVQHAGLQLVVTTEHYDGEPPLYGRAVADVSDDGRFETPPLVPGRVTFSSSLPPTSSTKIRFPRVLQLKAEENRILKENPQLETAVVVRQRIVKSDTGVGIPNLELRVLWGDAVSNGGSWRDSVLVTTDSDGWWTAKVLPGTINVRINGRVAGYQGTAWFDGRSGRHGVEAFIPATGDVVTLPPDRYVPSKQITGKLQYSDGSPAAHWLAVGHPVLWGDAGVKVVTDSKGYFTWTYPTGYPPRLYKVLNQEWMNKHNFKDRYIVPKLISSDPFVLQVPEKPPRAE